MDAFYAMLNLPYSFRVIRPRTGGWRLVRQPQ